MEYQEQKDLRAFAIRIRMAALEAIHSIGSGHVGGAMSIADTLAVLYPELAQTHVHRVCDAIQPSYPLSVPSSPAFHLFQHQGIFQ